MIVGSEFYLTKKTRILKFVKKIERTIFILKNNIGAPHKEILDEIMP